MEQFFPAINVAGILYWIYSVIVVSLFSVLGVGVLRMRKRNSNNNDNK
jgi:hypothetical protein